MKINKISLIIFVFFISSFFISSFLPDIIRSLLGGVALFLLPFPLSFFFFKITKIELPDIEKLLILIISWFLGSIFLFVIASVLNWGGVFKPVYVIFLYFILLVINIFYLKDEDYPLLKFLQYKKSYLTLLISSVFIITFLLLKKSPFPLQPAWDQLVYSFIANRMISFNEFHFFTTEYNPLMYTINYNLPIFHLITALSAVIFKTNPLHIFKFAPLFLTFFYGFISFLFTQEFIKDTKISYIVSIVSVWFFGVSHVNWTISFVGASLYVLLFPLLLITTKRILDNKSKLNSYLSLFIITFLSLFLFHHIESLILFLLLFLFVFIYNLTNKFNKIFPLISFLILILILQVTGIMITPPSFSFLSQVSQLPLSYRLSLLNLWFGALLTISYISIFIILFNKLIKRQTLYDSFIPLICLFLIVFILITSNIPAAVRFSDFLPFLIFLLFGFFLKFTIKNDYFKKGITIFALSLLIIFIFTQALIPLTIFLNGYSNQDNTFSSSFDYYDLKMAIYLNKNLSKDSLILSDPGEQLVLSGLSGISSFGGNMLPKERIQLVKDIILEDNVSLKKDLFCNLFNESKEETYLVISGRTIAWGKQKGNTPLYSPVSLMLSEKIDTLINSKEFESIHEVNNQIYLFKVSC